MADLIQLSSFPALSVEDTVSLEITNGRGDMLEIELRTVSKITWWKAVEVWSGSLLLARAETDGGDHGPREARAVSALLPGARLVLAKAKLFGVRTGMYELRDLDRLAGRRLAFLWQRDDQRDGPVAGFFRDLGGGVNLAADAAASAVEATGNAVGEFVSDVVETSGTLLRDGLDWVGGFLGGIPGIGPILRSAVHWGATVVSSLFDFAATNLKAGLDLAAGLLAGSIRLVGGGIGGLLAWDGRLFVRGFGDIVSSIAGPILVVLGKVAALGQAVLFMQLGERPLTQNERDLLRRVFRASVALYNVRIVEGFAGVFSINNRPFVLGNTIYMKGVDPVANPDTLVHECTHVWQNQNLGTRYATDAIWAQWTLPNAYTWEDELLRGHLRWRDFNKEAQATFLQEVWRIGREKRAFESTIGSGVFFKDEPIGDDVEFVKGGTNYTSLAIESSTYVRGGFAWRASALLR